MRVDGLMQRSALTLVGVDELWSQSQQLMQMICGQSYAACRYARDRIEWKPGPHIHYSSASCQAATANVDRLQRRPFL